MGMSENFDAYEFDVGAHTWEVMTKSLVAAEWFRRGCIWYVGKSIVNGRRRGKQLRCLCHGRLLLTQEDVGWVYVMGR